MKDRGNVAAYRSAAEPDVWERRSGGYVPEQRLQEAQSAGEQPKALFEKGRSLNETVSML
jgi:hypothetical protein